MAVRRALLQLDGGGRTRPVHPAAQLRRAELPVRQLRADARHAALHQHRPEGPVLGVQPPRVHDALDPTQRHRSQVGHQARRGHDHTQAPQRVGWARSGGRTGRGWDIRLPLGRRQRDGADVRARGRRPEAREGRRVGNLLARRPGQGCAALVRVHQTGSPGPAGVVAVQGHRGRVRQPGVPAAVDQRDVRVRVRDSDGGPPAQRGTERAAVRGDVAVGPGLVRSLSHPLRAQDRDRRLGLG